MILETERLIVRQFEVGDLDALFQILRDELVMRFSLKGPAKDLTEAKVYLDKILAHYSKWGTGLYALILKSSKKMIGLAGFMKQTIDEEEIYELGYRLLPEYWGQGLALEATKALYKMGFEKLKMDQMISIIEAKNERSIKLALKLGLVFWKTASYHGVMANIYLATPKYIFQEYSNEYPVLFQREKARISASLKNVVIEHIGSTSVPSLGGKGLLDLAIGIKGQGFESPKKELISLGYEFSPSWSAKDRLFFKRKVYANGIKVYHVHLMDLDSPDWKELLLFRDYLIQNPEEARKYEDLKRNAVRESGGDGAKYRKLKEGIFKKGKG